MRAGLVGWWDVVALPAVVVESLTEPAVVPDGGSKVTMLVHSWVGD